MESGSYSIKLDKMEKTVHLVIVGTFTPEQTAKFAKDYQAKIALINPTEYILAFDCRDLDVVPQEMVPSLEACFQLYRSSNFSKVVIGIRKERSIINMQLNHIARIAGLVNLEVQEIY